MQTLDALNACAASDFVAALDGVFEHASWVAAEAAAMRPFAMVESLHSALMDVVRAAPDAERLSFLQGHPDLSPSALTGAGLTAASRTEQAGFGIAALGGDLARFETGAAAYRARFRIPFIICVARHTARSALRVLEQRLAREVAEETQTAFDEIGLITRLRVAARVSGPGMPRIHGHLSTHVLDTARGCAAAGIRTELLREGVMLREALTDADGRVPGSLVANEPLRIGSYELRFHVASYFAGFAASMSDPPWYDVIPIRFAITEPEGRYHVPLLVAPWSYTTYRGS